MDGLLAPDPARGRPGPCHPGPCRLELGRHGPGPLGPGPLGHGPLGPGPPDPCRGRPDRGRDRLGPGHLDRGRGRDHGLGRAGRHPDRGPGPDCGRARGHGRGLILDRHGGRGPGRDLGRGLRGPGRPLFYLGPGLCHGLARGLRGLRPGHDPGGRRGCLGRGPYGRHPDRAQNRAQNRALGGERGEPAPRRPQHQRPLPLLLRRLAGPIPRQPRRRQLLLPLLPSCRMAPAAALLLQWMSPVALHPLGARAPCPSRHRWAAFSASPTRRRLAAARHRPSGDASSRSVRRRSS
mmetsp:Transcript_80534/g.224068  ORF Transcript_80534/g.224068 Transcript_80534/m.224068 type:complete len:293 (+) Transcript_80534:1524-2402(+)